MSSKDKDRLDFLQKLTNKRKYTGKIILRPSATGRGWRLHESNKSGAVPSVRDAIDNVIKNENYFQAQQHAKKQRLEQMNKQRLKPLDIVSKSNFSEFAVNTPREEDKKQGFFRKRW